MPRLRQTEKSLFLKSSFSCANFNKKSYNLHMNSIKLAATVSALILFTTLLFVSRNGSSVSLRGSGDEAVRDGSAFFGDEKVSRRLDEEKEGHKSGADLPAGRLDKKGDKANNTPLFMQIGSGVTAGSLVDGKKSAQSDIESVFDSYIQDNSNSNLNFGQSGAVTQLDDIYMSFDYSKKENDLFTDSANSYQKEKIYLNILASILIEYQYKNNKTDAFKKFRSWFTDRSEDGRKQVIKEANDYLNISSELEKIEAPQSLRFIRDKFIRFYKDAGQDMLALADKNLSDKELEKRILKYNESASKLTKTYIEVSDYISISGIEFDKNDPANIFVFPKQ